MKTNKRNVGFVLLTLHELQQRRDSRPVSLGRLKAKIKREIKVKEMDVIIDYLGRRGLVFKPKKDYVKWV